MPITTDIFRSPLRAVCFRSISFDLNMTTAIQIATKKPCKCWRMKTTKRSKEKGRTCSIHLAAC
uniref:Uncharacterized protein n=1 Tax=Rhizophora mucronata TaxID=61149 RepID=A0A2P2LP12_RHIMU